ncbi:MAG: DUF502 domain-containing protein [Deltaproteobacteria bacterium]|nr:DUF502 domain-containing protein [Deltaproteobacteria bacterium]
MKGHASLKTSIKNILLTGLAVIIPIGITIYILNFIIEMMDSLLTVMPVQYQPDTVLGFHIPGLGLIITVLLIFICGLITKSFIGNKLIRWGEAVVDRIPIVRGIYQATKKIVDSMFVGQGKSFKQAVLVEFPRKNVYSVAFVTGVPNPEIEEKIGKNFVSIYVPTTPNPTSGYFLMVAQDELIYLDMSVEDALTLVISTGIVNPQDGVKGKDTKSPDVK